MVPSDISDDSKIITMLELEGLTKIRFTERLLHEGSRGDPCAYCGGAAPGLTMDHVFPKALFTPVPSNAITVPACRPCNGEKGKGDEQLRVVSIVSDDVVLLPRDREHIEKIVRAIKKNRSTVGRAAHDAYLLRKQVDPLKLGGPLPVTFDGTALEVTLQMMMRGMFYKVHGRILPADCPILVMAMPPADAAQWIAIIGSDPDHHYGERGASTVEWLMSSTDFHDEHSAMCLFMIRGGVFYLAVSGQIATNVAAEGD